MNPDPGVDRDHPTLAAPRVARNTAYLALADVANKVMVFVFFALAARHLGTEKFGIFSLALAFTTMFSVFSDLGLGFLAAREIARDSSVASRYIGNALAIKVAVSVLLIGIVTLTVRLLGYPSTTVAVVGVTSLFILTSAVALYYSFIFQGFERMEFTALTRMLQTGTLITGGVLLGRGAAVTLRYAWLYVGAGFAAALASAVVCAAVLVAPSLRLELRTMVRMLRAAFPFGLASVFVVLYYWNGTALLSKFKGDSEVGLYSAAFRLVLGVGFLSFAFSGAMYPVMSRLHQGAAQRLQAGITSSLRYVMILAVPVAVFGLVLAGPLVRFIYGGQYVGSVAMLRVLAWWGGLASLNSMLSNYLYAVDRPGVVMLQSAVGLGVNVLLNFLLIPLAGGIGAAVSITAAEFTGTVMLTVAQRTTAARADLRQLAGCWGRCLIAAVLVAPLAWVLAKLHVLVSVAVGLSVYILLLTMLRGFDRADVLLLRRVLGKE
ncbi:MAG: flippase [candidate division WOR-3 bacterium]